MKLIIQIPCYNEEENLEKTIKTLPKYINKIDKIEYMVINDGSTDITEEIAKKCNVDYILNIYPNKGLANAFMKGIQECLKNGADIIVNIDGDNQYDGKDVEKIVTPILEKRADMVVGERQIEKFKIGKRFFQKTGSFVVRRISGTKVKDAPSGFRAYSRDCARKLNVFNEFTYTLETIVQAGKNKMKIENVKISSNPDTRKSRLFKNMFEYIRKSSINIIKSFIIYRASLFFFIVAMILFLMGMGLIFIRNDKVFIIAMLLIFTGLNSILISLKSNIDIANRKLLEDIQYKLREKEYEQKCESTIYNNEKYRLYKKCSRNKFTQRK